MRGLLATTLKAAELTVLEDSTFNNMELHALCILKITKTGKG